MKLTKDGIVVELENPVHVEAFKNSGFEEVKEQVKPAPKPEIKKPSRKKKD